MVLHRRRLMVLYLLWRRWIVGWSSSSWIKCGNHHRTICRVMNNRFKYLRILSRVWIRFDIMLIVSLKFIWICSRGIHGRDDVDWTTHLLKFNRFTLRREGRRNWSACLGAKCGRYKWHRVGIAVVVTVMSTTSMMFELSIGARRIVLTIKRCERIARLTLRIIN